MFGRFTKDLVTLIKEDGQRYENVKAAVHKESILIPDTKLPVEAGDRLTHALPSGLVDEYLVTDPGFSSGMPPHIPAHYTVKFEKLTARRPARDASGSFTVYNLSGHNARVSINSIDASTNVVDISSEKLFDELRAAIREGVRGPMRDEILANVDELAAAAPGPTFAESYGALIQLAANHMTILTPFLPALAQLLAAQAR